MKRCSSKTKPQRGKDKGSQLLVDFGRGTEALLSISGGMAFMTRRLSKMMLHPRLLRRAGLPVRSGTSLLKLTIIGRFTLPFSTNRHKLCDCAIPRAPRRARHTAPFPLIMTAVLSVLQRPAMSLGDVSRGRVKLVGPGHAQRRTCWRPLDMATPNLPRFEHVPNECNE